ncbi:hypothetical protein NE237_009247 [Protea cynaroides]|uniref:Ribosomal protein L18 n=1 Tax=Protea cynaroides TaxID=273540 RepID=A0A9Q0KXE8_9MAGN|nr:hypothetical protein NE237_009247 [Protea cynaroides]
METTPSSSGASIPYAVIFLGFDFNSRQGFSQALHFFVLCKAIGWSPPSSFLTFHRHKAKARQGLSQALVSPSAQPVKQKMVIPPPVRPPQIIKFLKPYVLKMHFTNKFVSCQVIHSPTATVASSASSQEKVLRSSMENTRDVAAAAKIGKLLGERLLLKGIPAVSVFLKREQKYHGKVRAVIDSVREAGVKLI